MHDIKDLEEAWKKYRFKKIKPWIFFVSIVIFSFMIFFLFFSNPKKGTTIIDTINSSMHRYLLEDSHNDTNYIAINKALDRLEVMDEKATLYDKSSDEILVEIPILDNNQNEIEKPSSLHEKPQLNLNIVETTSVTAYEDVERRFMQSKDIDDALFLARSYYKKGNYKKSEFWAFETNKLDSSLEESFLIFVKSKIKLGQSNEAKSILSSYLKRTNSYEARALLEELEQ